jgi:hypothetical protein
MGLSLLVLLGGITARGQVIGEVEAKVPFNFYAGNTRLPAGKYVFKVLDHSNLSVMEITSAKRGRSAFFEIRDSQAKANPSKDELIFNKHGNQYFLAKVYEKGDKYGSAVNQSRYEKRTERQWLRG